MSMFLKVMGVLALFFLSTPLLLGEEYPYLYRSPYFLGRGDTGIAVAEDEDAIFYNPAGIATGEGVYKKTVLLDPFIEFSQSTKNVIQDVQVPNNDPINILKKNLGKVQHIGLADRIAIVLRKAAFSVFAYSSLSLLFFKDPDAGGFESLKFNSIVGGGATFSLAHTLGEKSGCYIGVTGKYLKRNQGVFSVNATKIDEATKSTDSAFMTGSALGADIGFLYQGTGRTPLSLGLTVQDIGNTSFTPDIRTDLPKSAWPLKPIKQTVNVGMALIPGTKLSKLKFLLDVRDILFNFESDLYKKIHLGAEISVADMVGFMIGFNQGYPSYGTYLDLSYFRLDVGSYSEEVGSYAGQRQDTRYYFRMYVGL